MKSEFQSRRLFGITRAKGKMFEFELPAELHIAVPERTEPESLFVMTIGSLGDAAAAINDNAASGEAIGVDEDLQFAASFFDAFIASRFREDASEEVRVYAAAAYYLAHRPGSSRVLAGALSDEVNGGSVERLLRWILKANWTSYPGALDQLFGSDLSLLAKAIAFHFYDGSGASEILERVEALRARAYHKASARELLFVDLIAAIARLRVANSSWVKLPKFSDVSSESWRPIIQRAGFPKELWPSQIQLGEAGIFLGRSGVIQMPTSAGKTRAVEIILRSAFFRGCARLAVVVAPFRALCHEIAASLHEAFRDSGISVNEMTDVLQRDFFDDYSDPFDDRESPKTGILVVTPEKFLYVLRQDPSLLEEIGVVVYDEGHQFDTGGRGITYELLLTQIKNLLRPGAQTVLISAVVKNAAAIGQWLVGDGVAIVDGAGLLPTTRAYAFASWIEQLGQLMFFESKEFRAWDYFVPRVIEQQELQKLHPRENVRFFPSRNTPRETAKDVSLYLGIRLAAKGACAIFCGRKDTAAGMADRIVEIYQRGYTAKAPAEFADQQELSRLVYLVDKHFGSDSTQGKAARLGLFVHHSNTPHGVRLAVEHAMQHRLVPLVACTSTLAQGVNLPIRYLVVSGIYQGGERIKARDFQNLVGRAGRAGIHTEGIIIFSDPSVYDRRLSRADGWRFRTSCDLLAGSDTEDTSSSLLSLVAPFKSDDDKVPLPVPSADLCKLIYSSEEDWKEWAGRVVGLNPNHQFSVKKLVVEIRRRSRDIVAVESYLMASRGLGSFSEFLQTVADLAKSTLAYHLASDQQKEALTNLFSGVATHIESRSADVERQAIYAKTLLGIGGAQQVESWVRERKEELVRLSSIDDWLDAVWALFQAQNLDKFFHSIEPDGLSRELAKMWIGGCSYQRILERCYAEAGTKPWGEGRRRLVEGDVLDFLQNTLSFECALILAAIDAFLFQDSPELGAAQLLLRRFQKCLAYGVPDDFSVSAFEHGFADRMLAQELRKTRSIENGSAPFLITLSTRAGEIRKVVDNYPTYFGSILEHRAV